MEVKKVTRLDLMRVTRNIEIIGNWKNMVPFWQQDATMKYYVDKDKILTMI